MFSQACVKNSVHRGVTGADTPHLPNAWWDTPPWADTPDTTAAECILLECILVRCVLFIVFRITERKCVWYPFFPLFTQLPGRMLNCGGGNNGGGIKNVTCGPTFRPFSHIPTLTPIPFGLCDTIHKFHIASTLTLFESKSVCVRSSRNIRCYRK